MGADHYDTLGVPRDADAAEIKRAHRRAVSRHHPDKPDGDRDKFDEVQTAYLVLRDPDARAKYDRGEDPGTGPDNRESQITQMAIRAFMEAVTGGDIEHDDMVATARRSLEQQSDKAVLAIEKLAEQSAHWTDALDRVTRSEEVGPNFLRRAIDSQLRQIEEERRRITEHAGKLSEAIAMLDGFEYRVDQQEFTAGWDVSSRPDGFDDFARAHSRRHHVDAVAAALWSRTQPIKNPLIKRPKPE